MKRSPELKPKLWDSIVVLAVIALAAAAALTVWPSGSDNALTAVVTADGQELDRFAPAELAAGPRTYTHNSYTLTVAAEGDCQAEWQLIRCGLGQLAGKYPACVRLEA